MRPPTLLTRDNFREAVFRRDQGRCVFCPATTSLDAHHIVERRLWPDGGYYLDNGATVCETHHRACEATTISCDEVRTAAKIARVLLPPHLYPDEKYDKWANPFLPNGTRLRGELFHDESVQRVLAPVLHTFTQRVKYPRTYHLPWSPGVTSDDRVIDDLTFLAESPRIIVTVKMDGENTTMYRDYIHARSADTLASHPSRTRVKTLWGNIAHDIPEGWRICAENLQGRHSVAYENLSDWVYAFSVWNEKNFCLSWDQSKEWFTLLGLTPCPVIYDGPFDEKKLRKLWKPEHDGDQCEGYVVRTAAGFHYRDYRRLVGKYVRQGHVQTHAHWMQRFVPNTVVT